MKVEALILVEKIAKFGKGYVAGIRITKKTGDILVAETASWSQYKGPVYTVSLKRHKDDPGHRDAVLLDGACECPAIRPCRHMAQLYAVAKGITPVIARRMLKEAEQGSQSRLNEANGQGGENARRINR